MENIITTKSSFSVGVNPETNLPEIHVVNTLSMDDLTAHFNYVSEQVSNIQREINDKNSLLANIQKAIDILNNQLPQ